MKSFLVALILLVSFSLSYSQDNTPDSTMPSRFFMNMSFSGNLNSSAKTGLGLRLALGYKLTDNLSIMLSSGYMSSFIDPESRLQQRSYDYTSNSYFATTYSYGSRKIEVIPIELSLRYHFDFNGIKPYIMYSIIQDYVFNEGNYDAAIQTKNESTGEIVNSMSGNAYDLFNWKQEGFGELGSRLSIGVLIPVMNKLNLDISYSFYSGRGIHSFSVGFNFDF